MDSGSMWEGLPMNLPNSATANKKLKYVSLGPAKQNESWKDIIINAKSKAQSQI
jgi:hypothetical protein